MTDISEVLSTLKRGELSVDELIQELNTSLKIIKTGIDEIKIPIQELMEFEKRQSEELSKFESGNLALSQEINSLNEEKNSKELQLKEKQDNYTDATEKRTKLEGQKRNTTTELQSTENTLQGTKTKFEQETEKNERIVAEITTIVEGIEYKILEISKQVDIERDLIRKTKGERMALEYLIKRNHIEFNELKIINSLDGRKNTDMSTISKVTGLAEELIAKTLEGLMKRKLLTYDSSNGAITITGNLRL